MLTDGGDGGVKPPGRAVGRRAGWLLAGVGALVVGLLVAWGMGGRAHRPPPDHMSGGPGSVAAAPPARGAGELVARDQTSLVSRSALRVVTLLADVGDRVAQGQVLVQLDADELQADVAGAHAAWDSARQAQAAAARALERAQVLRQQAQADGERAEQLSVLAADALAPTELDARRAAAHTSALDVQAAQAQLQATEAAQEQARAAWQAASARLAEARLRAPFAGVVTARACSVGDVVSPGQSCLTVVAVDSLRVQARFDESLLSRMRLGDAAQVWLKSQPDTPVLAQVVRLNRAVDADTREFSVDLRLSTLPPNWALGERAMVVLPHEATVLPAGGR